MDGTGKGPLQLAFAAALILGSVAGGVLLGWGELVAIGAAFLLLTLIPWLIRGPKWAAWRDASSVTRVTRGEHAELSIDLNLGKGSRTWLSAVGNGARIWVPSVAGEPRRDMPTAQTHSSIRLTWPIDSTRRGSMLVGPERLEVRAPWSGRSRILATRTPTPVLVVPRVLSVSALSSFRAATSDDIGRRAGGEHIETLREYASGDPMKSVHWRASAHHGHLMVHRMVDSRVSRILVILDVQERAYDKRGALYASFDAESFEHAVDLAASWAWHGCETNQHVLLTTTASGAPLVEVARRNRDSLLDLLAEIQPRSSEACSPARVTRLMRAQGVSRATFITGWRRDISQPWIAAWQRDFQVNVQVSSV